MPQRPPVHRPAHWKPPEQREKERQRDYDSRRGTASERGYDSRWRKARNGYLAKHPLCAICQSLGVLTAANEVDHIIPHRGDKKLFWDSDNWQSLCKACHSRKTATEDSGFAPRTPFR